MDTGYRQIEASRASGRWIGFVVTECTSRPRGAGAGSSANEATDG